MVMHLNGTNSSQKVYHSSVNNEKDKIVLVHLLSLLFLNKWWIVAFTLLFGISAVAISLNMTPIYKSNGTIFISDTQNRYSYAGSDLSSLLTSIYGIGVGSTIANELQTLNSIHLSFKLAQKISAITYDENGRKFPILWKDYPKDSTSVGIDMVASRYRQSVSFSHVHVEADLVGISFDSPLPTEASTIVNLTMATYNELSSDQNRSTAKEALYFLSEEREKIENMLEVTEDSLRIFINRTGLVVVDSQSEELIRNLSQLEAERKLVEVKLVAVNSALRKYQSQLNEIKPGLASQYSEAVGPIIEKYTHALSELLIEQTLYKTKNPGIEDSHPKLRTLQSQIDQIKEQIKTLTANLVDSESTLYLSFANSNEGTITQWLSKVSGKLIELDVEKSQLEAQQRVISDYYNTLNSEFDNLPNEIIELAKLKRNFTLNEKLFLLVSNQYNELSLWEKTQFGIGKPLDYAMIPKTPIKPRKKTFALFGFFLGGFVGIGFVIIRDYVTDKISIDSLKGFQLPIIGMVPDFSILNGVASSRYQFINNKRVSSHLVTLLDHISPISEAFRRLRINMIYTNPDKKYKIIMVTSATQGEGKSTVAANLAITFSQAEKSVLIIDLDLRRPSQHKFFSEFREPGLTDSLFEIFRVSDITKNTIAPNVDLIAAGKKTPEPAAILDSKRLKQLIDKFSERYDHIILDTAPYGIISDSASLLRLVDGLIVVSRFNYTTNKELSSTLNGLQHLNADILGIVLNAFDPKKSNDYYTNYSYYKKTYKDYYQYTKK